MNAVLESILATGYAQSPQGAAVKVHSQIRREQGEFLQGLINQLRPQTTLEIGLAMGISALFICEALAPLPRARHIVLDPAQHNAEYWQGIGLHNLRAAGYGEMVEFYELPSHLALPPLIAAGQRVDFAFIDGAHLFDYALVDFFLVDKLLRVGGVVALDDLWMPSVQRLCRYIITNHSYSVFRYFSNGTEPASKPSFKRRLLEKSVGYAPGLGRALKIEYARPEFDVKLGLPNQCIAFVKQAEDQRAWDFHQDF